MEYKPKRFNPKLHVTKGFSLESNGYEEGLEKLKSETINDMSTPVLWTHAELYERKLIFSGMRQRDVLNAFRELKVSLMQKKSTSDNLVILATSLSGSGGASFVAMNLAIAFALDDYKTALYVDCNPYESNAETLAVEPMEYGVTEYLKNTDMNLEDIIYPTGIERLRVIPAGNITDSAAEKFNSARMKDFIENLKNRHPDRFIILDAPPIQTYTEARVLSKHADTSVLVVPFGKVVQNQITAAVETIGEERFGGLVFNYNY